METTVTGNPVLTLDSLLEKVYRHGGYDFRDYRRGTVTRRLARRLHASGVGTYPEYMRFLDTHPEEYQRLADDLTLKTSGFFRSPFSCEQVAGLLLTALLEQKKSLGESRITFWSAACARGEEPYSMAILVARFLGERGRDFEVSIRATDISQRALGEARAGVYSPRDVECLPPAILSDYFVRHGRGYEVKADIRQMVSFACFDLTSTPPPPFFNLDCVFCCNVLIYFQKRLQERVLNLLYDSLAVPGYLVLGEVETPTGARCDRLE